MLLPSKLVLKNKSNPCINVVDHSDELRKEARQLKKELLAAKQRKEESHEKEVEKEIENAEKAPNVAVAEYLEERKKYDELRKQKNKKGTTREQQTLALLEQFKSKLSSAITVTPEEDVEELAAEDDDKGWMSHVLQFDEQSRKVKDATMQDEDTFEIHDPRNPVNKRRREESKKIMREKKERRTPRQLNTSADGQLAAELEVICRRSRSSGPPGVNWSDDSPAPDPDVRHQGTETRTNLYTSTGPTDRNSTASHSGTVTSYHYDSNRLHAYDSPKVKLATYDGKEDWESFLLPFECQARKEDYSLLKQQLLQRFCQKDPPTTVRRKLGELRQTPESSAKFAEEILAPVLQRLDAQNISSARAQITNPAPQKARFSLGSTERPVRPAQGLEANPSTPSPPLSFYGSTPRQLNTSADGQLAAELEVICRRSRSSGPPGVNWSDDSPAPDPDVRHQGTETRTNLYTSTGPTDRNSTASHSGTVTSYHYDSNRLHAYDSPKVKLATYDGKEDWESFLLPFECQARKYGLNGAQSVEKLH
ncbi:Peptidyl-prolyl cis-trans isomerase CWC27-like [Acipenser ruthenus]|uniref:Peptidyl-prolyl cis-trans isomerase CWC27-like n=1 Tax=Acipenser ruthenus TaxID=7906 RepID=A0A444UGB8_ACIRT|nr:Peptidyl-prolyl cis-trans isomerase CWC27-like [Acipenser ruthenus]